MLDKESITNTVPISVIIPCFNSSSTIETCINSILNQTLLPSEILLIDDCSSDKGLTKKCIQSLQIKYKNQVDIKAFFSSINKGPGSSRNLGWKNANNPYIAFLDSDDVWELNKIMCQWNYLKNHPEVNVIGSNIKEEQLCNEASNNNFKKLTSKDLLIKNPFCNSSVIIKKSTPYRFEEGSYFSEDFMLWAKIICDKNLKAYYLPFKFSSEILNFNRTNNLSSNYFKMFIGELKVLRYITKKDFNKIVYYFSACFSFLKLLRRVFNKQMYFFKHYK